MTFRIVPLVDYHDWNITMNASLEQSVNLRTSSTWDLYQDALLFLGMILVIAVKRNLAFVRTKVLSLLWFVSCLALGFLLVPAICLFVIIFTLYREAARVIIYHSANEDGHVMDLMGGSDVFWAWESPQARSINNILVFIDFSQLHNTSGTDPLRTIQNIIRYQICSNLHRCWKLVCLRRLSSFGYYYWQRKDQINIEDYVRWMNTEEKLITKEQLSDYCSSIVNTQLPHNDTANWEILVGRNPLPNEDEICPKKIYPVLFRVHHSIGDGVALMSLLLDILAQNTISFPENKSSLPQISEFKSLKNLSRQSSEDQTKPQKVTKSVVEGIHKRTIEKFSFTKLINIIRKLIVFLHIPDSLLRQAFIADDHSVLHGVKLSGDKIVSWISEKACEDSLMMKIKRIRKRVGCSFSDVLFTALSESLESYCRLRGDVPRDLTVVIPSRVIGVDTSKALILTSKLTAGLVSTRITKLVNSKLPDDLNNKFTLGFLKLPIGSDSEKTSLGNKLTQVSKSTQTLRNSYDYLVNYWLLDTLVKLVPIEMIKWMVKKLHCTLAVSNLPGPTKPSSLNIHQIEDLIFWVPNKELTGIGLSVISYAGRLNFGIIADKAIIQRKGDVDTILNNIIFTIQKM